MLCEMLAMDCGIPGAVGSRCPELGQRWLGRLTVGGA